MPNPNVPLGSLNRLRASVIWTNFPALNVTASFLGKEGIRWAVEGEATTFIGAMVGAVTSPEPYLLFTMTMHLLKPQTLSDAYKVQMELNSLLGDGIVRPDVATGLSPYAISNCSIQRPGDLSFAGTEADYPVMIKGTYYINSSLFDL